MTPSEQYVNVYTYMKKVPQPSELGLPEKFHALRPTQESALDVMITSTNRFDAICGPTGSGKSLAAVMASLISGEPTCIVTASRGLQDQYMCLGLGTRLVSGNLEWLPIESYGVGSVVLGFDEFRSPNRRNWRKATVLSRQIIEKPCYKLTLFDGTTIVCSTDHKWLIGKSSSQGLKWCSTEDLVPGYSFGGSALTRILDVWNQRNDYTHGYLAGIFDGEGHLMQKIATHRGKCNGMDVNLSFAQKAGRVLNLALDCLKELNIPYTLGWDKVDVCRVTVSKRAEIIRALGILRPVRLLPKLNLDMLGMLNPTRDIKILSREYMGVQPVVALKTDTHTFVAEGFASHNSDFGEIGMVDIRGRSNYQCQCKPDDPSYTCEDGYVARCPYKGTIACPSSQAEMRAATSSLVVTNYAKWTAAKKYGQGMSHFKRVIFDEAHNAPGAIAQAMQVVLNHKEIEETLQLSFPPNPDAESMVEWKNWARIAGALAQQATQAAFARINGVNDPKPAWIRHYTHMRNLSRRLVILSTCKAANWVVDEIEQGYQFDPIFPGMYAESTLFLQVPKITLMSATLRPKTLFMCGVKNGQFTFKEFDSDFDPKRCPIYYVPTMRVDSRSGDLGLLWAKLDQIAAKRRDRKGIVHTVSYPRQKEIEARSSFSLSMLLNKKGSPTTEMVEKFKASPAGTILVSPSVGEGYDFPGDECRWQFMCKIPFEPPSKIVKAREAADKEYRAYQAMQQLVQSFGRGMRSREDFCESFIADEHCDWFLPKYGHLAPRAFHGVFRRVSVVPPPFREAL